MEQNLLERRTQEIAKGIKENNPWYLRGTEKFREFGAEHYALKELYEENPLQLEYLQKKKLAKLERKLALLRIGFSAVFPLYGVIADKFLFNTEDTFTKIMEKLFYIGMSVPALGFLYMGIKGIQKAKEMEQD